MPSEVGCTGEIKMRAMLNRFQDAAGLAVENTEGSPRELMRRGYAWVLLRYELKVEKRLPGMDEAVLLETRHTPGNGFYTLRVFRVFDEKNEAETLVSAKTSWVLIDLAAGRPVRATQRLPEVFSDVADDPPIDEDFVKIPRLSGSLEDERSFLVRFHDLDANGHANNAVYFEWIWEATPLDLLGWSVREVYAEFRVSVKFGDTVLVRAQEQKFSGPGAEAGARFFMYDMVVAGDPKARSAARFSAVWTPLETEINSSNRSGA
jgi:medium-chain acyl-[acyl-carrier-protein] hydrolase